MNKQILRLAIPNIISNLTVPMLGMVDLAIMGHLGSEVYIGAIALGGMIFNFVYWGFGFLRMGTSGLTAQAFGAGNDKEMSLVFGRAMLVGFLAGAGIILLQLPIEFVSFYLMDGSTEVESLASSYYFIRIWAAPATIGLYAFTGWFLGMQNSRYPMIIAITVNILNVLLNYLFVFQFNMSSDGVALGTVIAQYSGLVLAILLFLKSYRKYLKYLSFRDMMQWEPLKHFFMVNKDIMIRTIMLLFVFAYFTSESARMSNTILAINTLLLQYLFVFSYFIDGYAHAAEALTGKFIGAGDKVQLKKITRYLFLWGISLSIPFMLAYLFAGDRLLFILTDNTGLILQSAPYMYWVALLPLVSFAAFIWDGIYTGATATVTMRNTMIFSSLAIFLPVYYLTKGPLENHALWLAMILFMASRSILLTLFHKRAIYGRLSTAN